MRVKLLSGAKKRPVFIPRINTAYTRMSGPIVTSNEKQLQDIDNSFNALLIVVSVVQVGIVASILAVPFLGVVPSSPALLQAVSNNIIRSTFNIVIPIMALSVCWWGGSFFEDPTRKCLLKLFSWFLLFTQVFYSLNVMLVQFSFPDAGATLLIQGLASPMTSLVFLYFIKRRYERLTGIEVGTGRLETNSSMSFTFSPSGFVFALSKILQ